MKRATSLLFGAIPFGLYFFHSTNAHALGPVNVEIGGKVGYATNPNGDAGYNPLGLGIGARGGVEFLHGIYAGLNAMYYFGGSVDLPPPAGSFSEHAFQLGLEGGYGFHFSVLTIRPQLGLGNISFSGSSGNTSSSDSHIYLEPGVTGLVSLGLLYVGADLSLLFIPGVDQGGGDSKFYTSFVANGEVGVHF